MYSYGFPDLYGAHKKYGPRWIEVKNPDRYSFTAAQMETFPQLTEKGIGIWIMTAANEGEYHKLFEPPNWESYLK